MAFSLDDYTDLKEIGRGGMGVVYSAVQKSLGRKVVIKKMSLNIMADEVMARRFENEARSAAALDHENIIKIYDFGEDKGIFHIAMEYADGPDFGKLLKETNAPREVGLMVMLQVMKGIHFAHKKNIIHRDIKPENVIIPNVGRVKVLDFGLAHARDEGLMLTATDAVLGSPLYMSPEQALGVREKDHRSDIFSIGVLMYRVLAGRLPFQGSNIPSILHAIIYSAPDDLCDLAPAMPDDLLKNVSLCLEKTIEKRLLSLAPLIESVENYFYDLGIRDPADELTRQVLSETTGVGHFLRKLLNYHLAKGKQCADSGQRKRSTSHFREVLRYDPANKDALEFVKKQEEAAKQEEIPKCPEDSIIEVTLAAGAVRAAEKAEEPDSGHPSDPVRRGPRQLSRLAVILWIAGGSAIGIAALITWAFLLFPGGKTPDVAADTRLIASDNVAVAPAAALAPAQEKTGHVKEELRRAESKPVTKPVVRAAASTPRKEMPLTPAPQLKGTEGLQQSAVVGRGALHVHCIPWAHIFIDGARCGTAPTKTPLPLESGKHRVVLKRDGFADYEETVTISPNDTVRLTGLRLHSSSASP